ncbi:class II glutamine amidotransferase [Pasteurellaceae bacterium HPA106]|uniref:class II glutamine amidotransferase n=1 Tax=Spirabiliibacterium pneumoniae TaxID=221400 RepID=UPI001AADC31C|nr:class II glutamine amidotransferase [Spirabiliibacterium pneumoniae]MBE2895959.1 class II glutamine amidotransferase [Spirabiliibacterium pneumoniae]
MCQLLGMNCNSPTDIVFSFEGFRRRAGVTDQHNDGFGIAFFEGKGVRIFRDDRPGASSPVADLVKQYHIKSYNVIAHIRKATRGTVSLENTHPFIREVFGENWVFAHNGNLETLPELERSHCHPIGTTDSEAAFCYIVDSIKNRFASKPSEQDIFEFMKEITPELSSRGTFNYILSNGQWMLAHCSTNLHYICRKAPFGKACRVDDDEVIDFSQYAKPDDRVVIISTYPLTKDEQWTRMGKHGFAFFKEGALLFNEPGRTFTPEEIEAMRITAADCKPLKVA